MGAVSTFSTGNYPRPPCLRPLLVEILFIVFFYYLCEYAACGNYLLFILFSSSISDREMRAVNMYIEIRLRCVAYTI